MRIWKNRPHAVAPHVEKGCADVQRHSEIGSPTKPFWFFPSGAGPGFLIPDGVLSVIYTPSEMGSEDREGL